MTTTIAPPLTSDESLRGPFRLAIAILVVTTVTILMGALTTSTGSGLAYADWPFSDGQIMPESSYTKLPQFLEHFHRVFASSVGLLALALWLWLTLGERGTKGLRGAAFFGGCLVLTQGVIGGTGVLNKLPTISSVTHGTLAQLVLATFACIAYRLSDRFAITRPVTSVPVGGGRKLAVIAVIALIAQTIFGAIARHSNSSHALWTHVGNALVVFLLATIATAYAVGKLADTPGIRGIARATVLLLISQVALGFVALAIRNDAGKTPENIDRLGAAFTISFHVLIGAFLTMLMAALAAHVYRATRASDRERLETERS